MYAGNHAYYIGGDTAAAGQAIIDGINGGNGGFVSKPSSGNNVDNTWEYLTIRNFDSTRNDAIFWGTSTLTGVAVTTMAMSTNTTRSGRMSTATALALAHPTGGK